MKVPMTEYLYIDLNSERWQCRVCAQDLGDARGNYKEGTLVHDRDPEEIHPPLLDREKYQYTFSPDPVYCRILEYCCPGCGTQIEAEYLPPGHPPTVDMIWTSILSRSSGPKSKRMQSRSSTTDPMRTHSLT